MQGVDWLSVLSRGLVLLVAIPLHEAAHALAAGRLGDPTAWQQGRFSLNPLRHLDPLGSVCLLVLGIGWAKPVPVDPRNFKNPRRDMALCAAAGPACNFVLALLFMLLARSALYFLPPGRLAPGLFDFFLQACAINLSLGIFNLVPVPPFDGGRILGAFLPPRAFGWLLRYGRVLLCAVLALLASGLLDRPLAFLTGAALQGVWFLTGWVGQLAALLR